MFNLGSSLLFLHKYLPAAIVGIHAAASVPGASNMDKRTAVVSTITGVTDALAAASGDPEIEAVGEIVDIAASVFNFLTKKTPRLTGTVNGVLTGSSTEQAPV